MAKTTPATATEATAGPGSRAGVAAGARGEPRRDRSGWTDGEWGMKKASQVPGAALPGKKAEKNIKTGVDTIPQSDNIHPVKSEKLMPSLISDLRKATSKRGMKAELARAMKVSLPRISEWLAGAREPGGEYALRLAKWVKLPEAQRKSRGRASTPPQPKTRSTQFKHEKRKSNPPEG